MPEQADILTGYSNQTLFDIKLDTAKTLDSVFNRAPVDTGVVIPDVIDFAKGQYNKYNTPPPDNTFKDVPPDMTFHDAITSDNPKIQNLALDILARNGQKDPTTRLDLNSVRQTPYERGEKFLDKEYGFDARVDNEDWYHENVYAVKPWYQRWTENLGVFTARTVVGALAKFGEGLGYLGQMTIGTAIDAIAGKKIDYWANVADNAFSKAIESADKSFQDHIAPVYTQAGFDEQGFFSKLGDATFWNTSVADAAAFMASAFIPAGIASKLGLLGKGATAFGAFNRLTGGAGKLLTGADTLGEAGLAVFNTANEAAFEAAGRFTETRDKLTADRRAGLNNLTDEQIKRKAGEEASSTFGWNMAALTISNAWEMKNIIKPILGRSGGLAKAGSTIPGIAIGADGTAGLTGFANKFLRKGTFYAKKMGQATLAEGFWEENIQSAISRTSAGSYTRRGDDTSPAGVEEKSPGGFLGILKQYGKQTMDALRGNDREVSESIGLGGLIGIAGGAVGSKFGKRVDPITGKESFTLGERKQTERQSLAKIADINNARTNFIDMQSAKNPDGSIDTEKVKAKIEAWKEMDLKASILADIKEKKLLSPEETKVLENKLLLDYTMALIGVGKAEAAAERIGNLVNRKVDENGEAFIANPAEVSSFISTLAKQYAEIEGRNIQATHPEGLTKAELEAINRTRKDTAFQYIAERLVMAPVHDARKASTQEALNTVNELLKTGTAKATSVSEGFERNRATEYIQHYSAIDFYEEQLEKEAPQFIKDHYKNKIEEAKARIEQLNELVENPPRINRRGNIEFNDPLLKGKLYKDVLANYKQAYYTLATLDFLQGKHDAIADAILHPEKGLDNFQELVTFNDAKAEEEAEEKAKQAQLIIEEEAKEREKSEEMRKQLRDLKYTDKDIDAMDKPVAEKIIKDKTVKPPTAPIIVDGGTPSDTDPDEITPDLPPGMLAYQSRLKSINDQTESTDSAGNYVDWRKQKTEFSRLKKEGYNQIMNEFILEELPTLVKEGVYSPYLEKDQADWQDRFETPNTKMGEVIVFRDNSGNLKTFKNGRPAVFSFDETAFDDLIDERIRIRNREEKVTNSAEVFEAEKKAAAAARKQLQDGKVEKIKLSIGTISPGIYETTPTLVPIAERFPGFTWRLITTGKEIIGGQTFVGNKPIIEIEGEAFEAITRRIDDDSKLASNILRFLNRTYDTQGEAQQVANYLKNIVYVKKDKSYFRVGDDNKITYYKNDVALSPDDVVKQRININKKAMKDGYDKAEIVNDKVVFSNVTGEEYTKWITDQLITNRKVVRDITTNEDKTTTSKLYMKPVNAYFTFTIPGSNIKGKVKETIQATPKNDKVPVKKLTEDEWKLINNMKTSAEIRALGKRIKDEKIQLDEDEARDLREKLNALEAEEKAAKLAADAKAGKTADPFDAELEGTTDVPALIDFPATIETQSFTIDFDKDSNNFSYVPTDDLKARHMVKVMKDNTDLEVATVNKLNESTGAFTLTHLLVGVKGGNIYVFDKDFNRIPDAKAMTMKGDVETKLNEMRQKCKV